MANEKPLYEYSLVLDGKESVDFVVAERWQCPTEQHPYHRFFHSGEEIAAYSKLRLIGWRRSLKPVKSS